MLIYNLLYVSEEALIRIEMRTHPLYYNTNNPPDVPAYRHIPREGA